LQKGNPGDPKLADQARRMLRFLLQVVELAPVSAVHFHVSADSGFLDLEDGVQYAAAIASSPLDAIVTRDPNDFKPYVKERVVDAGGAVKLVMKAR
jgi:hypothetical protein